MKVAWQQFKAWYAGQAWFPRTEKGHGSGSISSVELGTPEEPPQGFLRKLRFNCRMLGRRIRAELRDEWPRLKPRLWVIIPCLVFQYIHAIFTGMAYYMHEPLPEDNTTLHDLGFEALPYLSNDAVSEILVYLGFAQFFAWLLSPFVMRRKTFSSSVVAKRVLVILVSCQILRIFSFLSTQLPAPAPHCRAPEPTSNVPWPVWWKVIIVNVARQASKGCGDLIFSSHLTFLLVFAWTYVRLGRYLSLKLYALCYAAATGLAIIASRKHYSVDVVVGAYVVPLVAFHYFRTWTHTRDAAATADNRRIVSLLADAAPTAAAASGGGGSDGSGKGGGEGHAVHAVVARHDSDSDHFVDLEMAKHSVALAPAPALEDSSDGFGGPAGHGRQPTSPVKQAWSALAELPRRIGSRGGAQGHRRTESQEPVLSHDDYAASASNL